MLGNMIDGCQAGYVRVPHGGGPGVHALPSIDSLPAGTVRYTVRYGLVQCGMVDTVLTRAPTPTHIHTPIRTSTRTSILYPSPLPYSY